MLADLHLHSTVSDGSDSIEELINKCIDKNLDFIAITDHDTLSHAKQLPLTDKIKVIAGIEVSAIDSRNGKKAHILGYNIKQPEIVEELVAPTLEARHALALKQIEILKNNGYSIDIDKLNKADNKYIYKQHILEYLLETEQIEEKFGSFYKTVFKNGGICAMEIDYVDVHKAVEAITKAGGQAVLAHAGQQQNFYLIDELVPLGLAGLEYNHLDNREEDKKILESYAEKYNLFLTGGSDYHGTNNNVENLNIADYLSPQSGVIALLQK